MEGWWCVRFGLVADMFDDSTFMILANYTRHLNRRMSPTPFLPVFTRRECVVFAISPGVRRRLP